MPLAFKGLCALIPHLYIIFPVYIKGRSEAVAMLDMMMQDQDFMKFMEEFENGFEEEVEQVCR